MYIINISTSYISFIMALIGLAFGSFANVVIVRLPLNKCIDRNVITKPSHCPHCKTKIKIQHNIPLISWILLKGRCHDCFCKIPLFYPIVELISCFVFSSSVWILPFGTLIWLKTLICGYALIILFFTDFKYFLLPDVIQIPLIIIGILFTLPQLLWPQHATFLYQNSIGLLEAKTFLNGLQHTSNWLQIEPNISTYASLLGISTGYITPLILNMLYKIIRKQDGMGIGDFKMLSWLGSFWGYAKVLEIFFIGAFFGTIVGIYIIITNRKWQQVKMPFGCILAITTPIIIFYESFIIDYISYFI